MIVVVAVGVKDRAVAVVAAVSLFQPVAGEGLLLMLMLRDLLRATVLIVGGMWSYTVMFGVFGARLCRGIYFSWNICLSIPHPLP